MNAVARGMRERRSERGSALLIVFLFAAIIAITLYTEMPIAVFEAKRQREQLLIDRGNEYAHAVRLFVRASRGQYPPNIEALENTNRVRFLRNRYKDPFTGKDDWRLLHAGPNGMIIDSKVQQAPNAGVGNGNGNSANGGAGIGSFGNNASGGNTANGANASLGSSVTTGANASFAGFNATSANPSQAGGAPSGIGSDRGSTGRAAGGQSGFGGFFSPPSSATGSTSTDGQPAGSNRPENPFSAAAQRAPAASANGGAASTGTSPDGQGAQGNGLENTTTEPVPLAQSGGLLPRSRQPSSADVVSGGGDPNAVDNGAGTAGGGNNSNQPTAAGAFGPSINRGTAGGGTGTQQGFGSGAGNNSNTSSRFGNIQNANLAGVASKAGGLSIKLINEQESYPLWEFFYDPTKDPMRGALGVQGGGANGQNGVAGSGSNNTSAGFGGGQNTPQSGGFNGSSGFGNNSFGGGNRGFGNNSFGNSTAGTSSQAPTINPSAQTMSTSSSGP